MKSQRHVSSFSGGIDRDTSVNKVDNTHYYDAQNMRIITEDPLTAGAMTSVKGNHLAITFNTDDVIIGTCPIRNSYNDKDKDSVIFFVYNPVAANNSIYLLEGDVERINTSVTPININQLYQTVAADYRAGYIYRGADLNFSLDHLIKSESRYESLDIRKVYWVDGLNPIRYINLTIVSDLALAGTPMTSTDQFELNPKVIMSAPTTSLQTGGGYKSGLIQHAYQLYIKNGAKTVYSPTSNVLSLAAGNFNVSTYDLVGNTLDINTGNSVRVVITNLDPSYNRIRIVSIHYTTANLSPIISIVGEFDYNNISGNLNIVDTGINNFGTIPIEEFRLQGQIDYIADSLASKNNIMFYANLKENIWNPSWLDPDSVSYWDARAVRFRNYVDVPGAGLTGYSKSAIDDYSPEDGSIDGISVLLTGPKQIQITIENFTTWANIEVGRTIIDVTNVVFDRINLEYTILPNTYNTLSNVDNITDIIYTALIDTLVFNVNSIDILTPLGVPDTLDWLGIYNSGGFSIHSIEYEYDTVGATTLEARPWDSSIGETRITVPSTDTIIDWNTAGWNKYTPTHDGVNNFNNTNNDGIAEFEYKFKSNGDLGAEGPNVEIDFVVESLKIDDYANTKTGKLESPFTNTGFDTPNRSSQREEVYRTFIVFFNTKMQYSTPQWIADIRMPSTNDGAGGYLLLNTDDTTYVDANYLYPRITIKNMPVDSDLLGWQIFRCERKNGDRSVLAKGLISALDRDLGNDKARPYSASSRMFIKAEEGATLQYDTMVEMVSPEINYNKNLVYLPGDRIRVDGRFDGIITGTNNGRYLKITSDKSRDAGDSRYLDLHSAFIENTQTTDSNTLQEKIYNTITYRHEIKYSTYYGQKGTTLIAATDGDPLVLDATTTGYGAGAYVRNVFYTQYSGNTFEARSYNSVIPYSDFALKTTLSLICRAGDTFINYFAYLRAMVPTVETTIVNATKELVLLPTESSINNFYRLDPIQKYTLSLEGATSSAEFWIQEKQADGIAEWPVEYPTDLGDLYRYNSVYSISPNAITIQNKVFDSNVVEESPTKIIATDKKSNNEYFDSWTNIKVNNYIELEGKFGDIQNVISFGNRFFAFQNKAIAVVSINDRSLIQDNNKVALTLGTGEVLERFDYMTTSSGISKHTDVVVSNKSIYYLDRSDKIIYNLTAEGDNPISEVNGIRSFLKSYADITVVKTGFDPTYKEILFYITDGTIYNTIAYSEYIGSFVSRYSFYPEIMYMVNDHFYSSSDTTGGIYSHNVGDYGKFYGTISDSFIDIIINPNGNLVDKYDIIDIRTDLIDENGALVSNQTISTLSISNSYLSTTKTVNFTNSVVMGTSLSETAKNIIKKWRLWLLPDDSTTNFYRFVDTYVRLKLSRSNQLIAIGAPPVNHSCRFTLHDIETFYRATKN